MILGDLLDAPVVDAAGGRLGFVIDVRLVLDGPPGPGLLAAPRVLGLLVSPRTGTSFLGFERTDVRAPAGIAHLLRWRHRGTFLVAWPDVAAVTGVGEGREQVLLVEGYRRWAADLGAVSRIAP